MMQSNFAAREGSSDRHNHSLVALEGQLSAVDVTNQLFKASVARRVPANAQAPLARLAAHNLLQQLRRVLAEPADLVVAGAVEGQLEAGGDRVRQHEEGVQSETGLRFASLIAAGEEKGGARWGEMG